MMTVKELVTGPSCSPDGRHWEPALPLPDYFYWRRLRDAWEVLQGRAHAIIQTPQPAAGGAASPAPVTKEP